MIGEHLITVKLPKILGDLSLINRKAGLLLLKVYDPGERGPGLLANLQMDVEVEDRIDVPAVLADDLI